MSRELFKAGELPKSQIIPHFCVDIICSLYYFIICFQSFPSWKRFLLWEITRASNSIHLQILRSFLLSQRRVWTFLLSLADSYHLSTVFPWLRRVRHSFSASVPGFLPVFRFQLKFLLSLRIFIRLSHLTKGMGALTSSMLSLRVCAMHLCSCDCRLGLFQH